MADRAKKKFPTTPPPKDSPDYAAWMESQIELYEMAIDGIFDAVIATKPDGNITYLNPAACALLAIERKQALRHSVLRFFCDAAGRTLPSDVEQFAASDYTLRRFKTHVRSRSGDVIPVELSLSRLMRDGRLVRFIGTLRDRREDLAREHELWELARTDALTLCRNRLWFNEELHRLFKAMAQPGASIGVIFIDLDNFKRINDDLSYDIGDAVLRGAADTIRSVVRSTDSIVRLGGDEFVLLLENVGFKDVMARADRIVAAVHDMHPAEIPDGSAIRLTASVGVSVLSGDDPRISGIFRLAEQAKRLAKETGKDRACVLPEDVLLGQTLQ